MRTLCALLLLTGAGCLRNDPALDVQPTAPAATAAGRPTVVVSAPSPKPPWVGGEAFVLERGGTIKLYASASAPVPTGGDCPEPPRIIDTATNRARAALLRAAQSGEGAAAMGTVSGVETEASWYDGDAALHVLVSMTVSKAPAGVAQGATPTGDPPLEIGTRIVERARARLEESGACKDPSRRAALPCCGAGAAAAPGAGAPCLDKTRFDTIPAPNMCKCGDGPECGADFRCENARCVCRGASCPCDILKCKVGEKCADNRCF